MDKSDVSKRHRPTEVKIDLGVYFLPDRLPVALRHPLEAAGGPDAVIRLDQAEGHLSPSTDGATGWQITLTVCPAGEGHFMGIDLSIPQAKRLIKELDYVIKWQKGLKTRAEAESRVGKKGKAKKAKAKTARIEASTKPAGRSKDKKK